jgi:hypothetical protein
MEILKKDELLELLTKVEITNSSKILTEDEIESVKSRIDLNPVEVPGMGNCLLNAFRVAEVTGSDIVEGVAHVIAEKDGKESETIIKHAWNFKDNIHFDVTRDYVWTNFSFDLAHSEYHFTKKFTTRDYNLDEDSIEFNSNVDLIASSIKFFHTKQIVLSVLYSLNLDEMFHEQLLNECIKLIKEKKRNHKN